MGSYESDTYIAKNIEFRSNDMEGAGFDVDKIGQYHSYSVYWTLKVNVVNKKGEAVKDALVKILDKNGTEFISQKTDSKGSLSVELLEYSVDGLEKTVLSPYTVITGKKKTEVQLNKNSKLTLEIR